MDPKPFDLVMKFIDSLYFDPEQGYYRDTLLILFNNYNYNDNFLSPEEYLYDKTGLDNYKEYTPFSEQFVEIDRETRLKLVVALYNLVYFSDESEERKTRFSKFLYRYNIKLNDNDEYRDAIEINIEERKEGSFAYVYMITDNYVQKQLKDDYWNNNDIKSRFKNEFNVQEKLKLNGAKVLSVMNYNPTEFSFLMERADCDVFDFLSENKLSFETKIKWIRDILSTMKIAHDNDIIHRDLHYGNTLIKDGELYINDFGFAKDTNILRSRISTPSPKPNHHFIAPEGLIDFNKLDKQSDIYSIGRMIDYIMSDGSFAGKHTYRVLVEKCTRNEKNDRYLSMKELIDSFEEIYRIYNLEDSTTTIFENIKNDKYTESVEGYILGILPKNRISNIMVNQQSKLINIFSGLQSITDKQNVIKSIADSFINATGYNGWANYEIFGDFAYNVIIKEKDLTIQKIAYNILKICAATRYRCNDLIESIPPEILVKLEQ